jgi:hypothetical protein
MVRPVNPAELPRSGKLAALAATPINAAVFKERCRYCALPLPPRRLSLGSAALAQ